LDDSGDALDSPTASHLLRIADCSDRVAVPELTRIVDWSLRAPAFARDDNSQALVTLFCNTQ
jgi:hypothetical protein